MVNKTSKFTLISLTFVLAFFFVVAAPSSISAGTLPASYSGSFASAWERYTSSSDKLATLTYGYNTAFINEDYAWANHSTRNHYAALYNGQWHAAASKDARVLSKIEVRHAGSGTWRYQNNW